MLSHTTKINIINMKSAKCLDVSVKLKALILLVTASQIYWHGCRLIYYTREPEHRGIYVFVCTGRPSEDDLLSLSLLPKMCFCYFVCHFVWK